MNQIAVEHEVRELSARFESMDKDQVIQEFAAYAVKHRDSETANGNKLQAATQKLDEVRQNVLTLASIMDINATI